MQMGDVGITAHAQGADLCSDPDLLPDYKSRDRVEVRVERVYLRDPLPVDHGRLGEVVAKHYIVAETRRRAALIGDHGHHRRVADGVNWVAEICVATTLAVPVGTKMTRTADIRIGLIEAEGDIKAVTVILRRSEAVTEGIAK